MGACFGHRGKEQLVDLFKVARDSVKQERSVAKVLKAECSSMGRTVGDPDGGTRGAYTWTVNMATFAAAVRDWAVDPANKGQVPEFKELVSDLALAGTCDWWCQWCTWHAPVTPVGGRG